MSDYRDYNRDRGGDRRGGGGYNNYNKKRRYQDDDDHRDYRQQRARYEDPGTRLRKETLTIAESPLIRIEESVKGIAKSFVSHFDNDSMRTGYINFLKQLVVEQPFKIPFVAAIALYANHRNADAGKTILKEFTERCQYHLDHCEWKKFKLVLRFLACSSSMISDSGLEAILNSLISFAEKHASEGNNKGVSEELLRIVLLTIPFLMSSAPRQGNAELSESLVEKVSAALSAAKSDLDEKLAIFSGSNAPYAPENMTTLLLQQLNNEKNLDWRFQLLPRPWEQFTSEFESAERHDISLISMPSTITGPSLFPEMYVSVFHGQIVETVPASSDAASTLLRDAICDTVNGLDFNRVATARFMIDLDCYYAPDVFLKRATPFDKIKDLPNQNTTWKPEDIVVDAVFSLIFRLPQPEHKLVYYHSVLTEICKIAPQAVAPSLGRAIRFLYKHIDALDIEIRWRFLDWFAHHLSNFGFTWKWLEWSSDLSLPDSHPKKALIVEAIDKEIRLSFANRVRGTLPEVYDYLIPSEKEKDLPDFKYEVEDSPFSALGKQMLGLIRQKASDAEIDEVWTKIIAQAESLELPEPSKFAIDIFITCICHVGAKSLSHALSCIERCKDKIAAISSESPNAQRDIVASVMSYWRNQPGVGANVVDKLLNYSLLTPISVAEWLLQDAGPDMLPRAHAWEMFSNTMRKVGERTKALEASLKATAQDDTQVEEATTLLKQNYEKALAEQNMMFTRAIESLKEYGSENLDMMNEEEDKWLRWWSEMWLKAVQRNFEVTHKVDGVVVEATAAS